MILLDTHIWVWWVHGDPRLNSTAMAALKQQEATGLGVSIISCWEVATARVQGISMATVDRKILDYSGVEILRLTP